MAVTPTYNRVQQGEATLGPWRAKIVQMSMTGTYVTGGIPVSATDMGIGKNLFGIQLIQVITQPGAGNIYDAVYVTGNLVLMGTTGAEFSGNTAGGVIQLIAFGY